MRFVPLIVPLFINNQTFIEAVRDKLILIDPADNIVT